MEEGPAVVLEHHRQPVGNPVHRGPVQDHGTDAGMISPASSEQVDWPTRTAPGG